MAVSSLSGMWTFLVLRMRAATDGQLKAQLVGEMTRWKRLADEWESKCQSCGERIGGRLRRGSG